MDALAVRQVRPQDAFERQKRPKNGKNRPFSGFGTHWDAVEENFCVPRTPELNSYSDPCFRLAVLRFAIICLAVVRFAVLRLGVFSLRSSLPLRSHLLGNRSFRNRSLCSL